MTEAESSQSLFVIDGSEYEVPNAWSFNMEERRILWDYCGLTQEDFLPLEGESEEETDERCSNMTRHPGWMDTLMHVAYARGNPKLSREKVKALISSVVFADAVEKLALTLEKEEDDALPPALTSELDESSPRSSNSSESSNLESGSTSGSDSTNGSDVAAESLEPTGTTRLDTSSPESLLKT